MSSMPWVKLYTEMLDDPKIGRLPDAIKWRFVSLVLLAGECDNDGALQHGDGRPMTEADIAWRLRIDELRCTEELEALLQCGVVELDADVYYLPKFSDRQGRPQSEKRAQWRERQARYRDTHETKESVTRDSRVNNASRVEKSREEKSRVDSADKPRKPVKPKTERATDELFDAIAKVTCTDPATAGASIGKIKAALVKANPPYTASEVLKFGADWPSWKDKPPTLWQLKEQIGIVRNGNGNGHHDDSAESIKGYTVYR